VGSEDGGRGWTSQRCDSKASSVMVSDGIERRPTIGCQSKGIR
jgi:hypothetical protein